MFMCVNSMLLEAVASKLVRGVFPRLAVCQALYPVVSVASQAVFFFYYNTLIVEVWQREHGNNEHMPEIESKRRDK